MLAIIPARGGSKGLPGKNVRLLNGKPLIAYSVEAALKSKLVSRVICSTDSIEIANIARAAGAEVPFMRPSYLAEDNSIAMDNYIYTLDRLNSEGFSYENYCVLLPTCPLRNTEDIDNAIEIFNKNDADSVISFYQAPHPIAWHKQVNNNGLIRRIDQTGDSVVNRQDERTTYVPNGAIYIFKHQKLKTSRQYYTDKSYAYIMDAIRSVDIDTLLDFQYAEFLLQVGMDSQK